MTFPHWPNLVTMFFAQADRLGERPFLWSKRDGAYAPMTWRSVAAQVSALARGLEAIGVERGDRVVIVSESRPEWLIADLAIMAVGGITVPVFTTNTVDDHRFILEDSGAKGLIVSSARLAEPALAAVHQAAKAWFVVTMDPISAERNTGVDVHSWGDLITLGNKGHTNVVAAAGRLTRDDVACIIYTSGTGGVPKGVMLHHGAILHNCAGAAHVLEPLGIEDEVFLSFLPLSHSYEHTAGLCFPIFLAAQIYYAEGVEKLAANMVEARPTIMTAVPRLYEALHQRFEQRIRRASRLQRALILKALNLGRRRFHDPNGLGLWERVVDAVVERLVRDKIRAQFGGRLKALVSGGAPLNAEIGLFFQALGINILQGYGQTEAAPVVSVNSPGDVKMHTVGRPLKDTEVRIAEDGEILVRGELVMKGYWNNDEATALALRDGWLHTGDVGAFDADGHLMITDRKKDLIVNSGGDNISPTRIEGFLIMEREIGQAMVYGDRRPNLVALIVPDLEWMKDWARTAGRPPNLAALHQDPEFVKALGDAVQRVNARLPVPERVRRFAVAHEPMTVENEQLTPTLKIRRHVVRAIYGDALERLYG
ncbi:MAG: long-chain fatty acid--CoA ligase [Rhodospirillales bacterium]|nr:long-chain fatty acid--CoA ligase [Rhodospirillales bacterium]